MYEALVLLQILSVVLSICAVMTLFRGEATYAQKLLLLFTLAVLVQSSGYLWELCAKDMGSAMVALKMEYLGGSFVVLFYMLFVCHYCGYRSDTPFGWMLAIFDILVLTLVWTADHHHLFYASVKFVDTGLYPHLEIQHGIGFWIYVGTSIVVPYLVCIFTLIRRILEKKKRKRRRALIWIIIGTTYPMIMLILYVAGALPVGYEPTSAAMALAVCPLVILIWNRRDFDMVRVASNTALDSLQNYVIVVDEDRKILRYNTSAAEKFPQLTEKQQLMEVDNFPIHILSEEASDEFELGGRHYKSQVREIRDHDSEICGYSILITDITEMHEYIQELDRMRRLAESANRAKSDFLANMSHEIRTPMNTIMGMSEFVMDECQGRKVYGFAHNIRVASQHLLSLVNNILDLSKVEAGRLELQEEAYRIKQLIDEVEELMQISALQNGLRLEKEFDTELPHLLYGDAERIRQIVINVVNNAIKFTKKGSVKLMVSGIWESEKTLRLRIIVEDTGIGIKTEDLERIFEIFQQVDMKKNRAIEGSGLGLSITKQLVELMNGEMQVESEYGRGTRFIIELPQQIADARKVGEMPDTEERRSEDWERAFKAPGYRVLVVDDNKMNLIVIQRHLERYACSIDLACSGQEAIEKVDQKHYDMIFMDHMMPELDGVETVGIMQEEYREKIGGTVFVALTANALHGAREMYLRNGFHDFLAKPIERQKLHLLLEKWIPEKRKVWTQEQENEADRYR